MIELTSREQILFNLLKAKRKGATTTDLVAGLKDGGVRTNHHSMTVTLKYLSFKIAPEGWIIERIKGGLGRGNEACYQIRKAF